MKRQMQERKEMITVPPTLRRMALLVSIFFGFVPMFLYAAFYRTRLIPRWLSGWGLIGAVIYVVIFLAKFFGIDLGLERRHVLRPPIVGYLRDSQAFEHGGALFRPALLCVERHDAPGDQIAAGEQARLIGRRDHERQQQ